MNIKTKTGSRLSALLLVVLMAGSSLVALSGCNTTAGMGKDLEAAGEAINEEAEEEKKY